MYLVARVERISKLCENVNEYLLKLDRKLGSAPGQFVMVWVPRVGEIPISVAWEKDTLLKLIIARKGVVTSYIHNNIGEGCRLFLRGPLGKGFEIAQGEALIVAGGYGAAPMLYLASTLREAGSRVTVALGFRENRNVMLVEEFEKLAEQVFVATEDGSMGFKGQLTELVSSILSGSRYDMVYTCGREQMMERVVRMAMNAGIKVQASLERLIKCGIGVCGSCTLEPRGLRVCRDGPVFNGYELIQLDDFGRWWRDASGKRVPLPI